MTFVVPPTHAELTVLQRLFLDVSNRAQRLCPGVLHPSLSTVSLQSGLLTTSPPLKLCREQNSKQTGVRYIGIKGECSTQKHFGGGHDYVAHPNLLCSILSIIISIVSHETCLFLCVSVASQRVTHTTVVHLILSGLGLRVVGCLCAAQAHILVSVVMAELFMLPNSRSPTYSNPI